MTTKTTRSINKQVNIDSVGATSTPLFLSSSYSSDSEYFYGRNDNPNTKEFVEVIRDYEGAEFAFAYPTGMAAIRVVLSYFKPGTTLVLNDCVYGCSLKAFKMFTEHFGMKLVVLDLCDTKNWKKIPKDSSLVFFETPTNPFLKTIDIKGIKESLISNGNKEALICVDNTWATPVFQHPLSLGADISLHSATKYLSGHSDVMGGVILTKSKQFSEHCKNEQFYGGMILSPHDSWLLRRSLLTLEVRLQQQKKCLNEVCAFLSTHPFVEKVYLPEISPHQLKDYAGILFFEFNEDKLSSYESFRDRLTLFRTGTAMACVFSTVAQPYSGSHASLSEQEKEEMGIGKNLVRLCFGLESPQDLIEDLRAALV